jgi:hypothetical protein
VSSRRPGPVKRRGIATARLWVAIPRPLLLGCALAGAAVVGCFPTDDLDSYSHSSGGGTAGSGGAAAAAGSAGSTAAGAAGAAGSGSGVAGSAGSGGQAGSVDAGGGGAAPDAGDPLDASTGSDTGADAD